MNKLDLNKCFCKSIFEIPQISKENQLKLLKEAKKSNIQSRHKLIACNLRFVLKIASKYKCTHLKTCDLVNEGVIGLSRAIDEFNVEVGFSFLTYAVWWIRRYIQSAIDKKDNTIKLSDSLKKRANKEMRRVIDNNRLPSDVYEFMQMKGNGVSINCGNKEETKSKGTIADIIKDDTAYSPEHSVKDKFTVENLTIEILKDLPDSERYIISKYFGINTNKMTMKDLAKRMKCNVATLRQMREQAILRIKHSNDFERKKDRYTDFIDTAKL